MMELLDAAAASFVIVLTKTDKLNATERAGAINDAHAVAREHAACHPELFATSADSGEGLPELRGHLAALAETGYKTAASGRRA